MQYPHVRASNYRFGTLRRLLVVAAVSLFLFAAGTASAQFEDEEIVEPTYDLGDQYFTIRLGTLVPLFFQSPLDGGAINATNLRLGGSGALSWQGYLNERWSIGGELSGTFNNSVNARTLYMVPITARLSYNFSRWPFEFPLHVSAGAAFQSLEGDTYFGPIVKPGAGVWWNATDEWAFGGNMEYWWVPQFYRGAEDRPPDRDSRFGNFLDITLGARYSF
ncbi:MAG: TP0733 family outer membrane beta-barrel protein [Spirochaetales bacterium]